MTATAPPPACERGCPDAEYWRDEVIAVRADLTARDRAEVTRLLARIDPGELLAYDDAPAPMTTGERLVAAALVGPWIAATTAWTVLAAAGEAIRWIRS